MSKKENFKVINGFDFPSYFDPKTTDAQRSDMRSKFIVDKFKQVFPFLDMNNLEDVQKFISVDKIGRRLYQDINGEFHQCTQLESVFLLQGLTEAEREVVINEKVSTQEILSRSGRELKRISDESRQKISAEIAKKDKAVRSCSPFTLVSLVTLENVPAEKKKEYLKESDKEKARLIGKNIVIEYQKELIQLIRANGDKFPDKFNPLD